MSRLIHFHVPPIAIDSPGLEASPVGVKQAQMPLCVAAMKPNPLLVIKRVEERMHGGHLFGGNPGHDSTERVERCIKRRHLVRQVAGHHTLQSNTWGKAVSEHVVTSS